jgi:glycosyltransferase involved in cell wall biosynthesis
MYGNLRVGLLYPVRDPVNPRVWSGTVAGFASGLQALGCVTVPLGTWHPRSLSSLRLAVATRTGRSDLSHVRSRQGRALRSRALRRNLTQAARMDYVIAMGSEAYDLATVRDIRVPTATFDDASLVQQWANANADISNLAMTDAETADWFEQQRRSVNAADLCCLSTQWAAESFVSDYGVPRSQVLVVGMGHRPRSIPLGRDWSRPRFLHVGVDWRRKNGEAVLRAFALVRREFPDAQLDVVGRHPEITEPGVVGHGELRRDDPVQQQQLDVLFGDATVFVLPSRFDPAGIAYLEAASAGLPVVATSEGGAGQLLGDSALVVHPDDDEALVRAMVRLSNPTQARRLGALAAERAADYSWAHVARRVLTGLGADDRTLPDPSTGLGLDAIAPRKVGE